MDSERAFSLPYLVTQLADSDKATVQKTLSKQHLRYPECPGQPTSTCQFTKYTTLLLEQLAKQDQFSVVLEVCDFTYQQS
jgi:hypothetical protein